MTLRVANLYHKLLSEKAADIYLVSLENKAVWERGQEMLDLERQFLVPAQKFVFCNTRIQCEFSGHFKTDDGQ